MEARIKVKIRKLEGIAAVHERNGKGKSEINRVGGGI